MFRGTTPKLYFTLPFPANLLSELYITIVQPGSGENAIEKTLSDCDIDGVTVAIRLTQAETLSLAAGDTAEIQLRAKTADGDALASDIIHDTVERILKDGEI